MAVRIGAPDTRIAAMEILVRAGFAEEAVRGVVAGVKDGREQDRVFLKFLDRLGPESQYDGMLSFMALLLRPEWHSSAQYVVTRLKQRAAGTDEANRWRVLVAAKSGADFGSLSDSSLQLEPPLSVGVLAWLYHLTHASPQERKRLTAARGTQSRIELLRDIDFRRGQLVDGLYGVAAIVETVSVVDKAKRRLVWSRPRREMITLPALSLRLRGDDNSYVVTWNDRTIGSGVALDRPQPIRRLGLEYYYGVMEQLAGKASIFSCCLQRFQCQGGFLVEHSDLGPYKLKHVGAATQLFADVMAQGAHISPRRTMNFQIDLVPLLVKELDRK